MYKRKSVLSCMRAHRYAGLRVCKHVHVNAFECHSAHVYAPGVKGDRVSSLEWRAMMVARKRRGIKVG